MTPLLFMVLILMSFLLFSPYFAVSIGKKLKKNFWTVKRISIIITGYIGLGLIAYMYLALSLTGNNEYKTLSSEEIERIMIDENQFSSSLSQKQGDQFDERYLVDEWSMKLSSDEVTLLRESEDTYGRIYVLIDWRDDAGSNEIYVKTYQIPHVNRGIDLTKEVTNNQFKFADDTLIVKKPPEKQLIFNNINPKIEMLGCNNPMVVYI